MQTQRKLIASSSSARLSTLPVKINFYVDVWTSVTLAERLGQSAAICLLCHKIAVVDHRYKTDMDEARAGTYPQ